MTRELRSMAAGLILVCIAGCGGNSASVTSSAPTPGDPISAGPFDGRAAETNPPLFSHGSNTTAVGIVGQFSSLRARFDSANKEDWRILATGASADSGLISLEESGSFRRLTTPIDFKQPSPSPFGGQFVAVQGSRIALYSADALAVTPLTSPPAGEVDETPSYSWDGSSIVFVRRTASNRLIMRVPVTGGAPTTLVTVTSGTPQEPKLVPSGLFYRMNNGSQIYRASVTGANPIPIINYPNGFIDALDASPDGNWIAYSHNIGGDTKSIYLLSTTVSLLNPPIYTNTATEIWSLDFSPDSQTLFFAALGGTISYHYVLHSLNLQTLQTVPYGGANGFLPISQSSIAVLRGPRERLLVGSGSIFQASVADGAILSFRDDAASSALVFDALTPSTVVMKNKNDQVNFPNSHTYSVDADSISLVAYGNRPRFTRTAIVGTGASIPTCNGFLVNITEVTGKVNLVVPFNGARSSQTVKQEGAALRFTGEFLGVFDADGKNLAPGGATEVEIVDGLARVVKSP